MFQKGGVTCPTFHLRRHIFSVGSVEWGLQAAVRNPPRKLTALIHKIDQIFIMREPQMSLLLISLTDHNHGCGPPTATSPFVPDKRKFCAWHYRRSYHNDVPARLCAADPSRSLHAAKGNPIVILRLARTLHLANTFIPAFSL